MITQNLKAIYLNSNENKIKCFSRPSGGSDDYNVGIKQAHWQNNQKPSPVGGRNTVQAPRPASGWMRSKFKHINTSSVTLRVPPSPTGEGYCSISLNNLANENKHKEVVSNLSRPTGRLLVYKK